MIVRAHAGWTSFVALPMWTVERSMYLRIGSSGEGVAMPGSVSEPTTSPSGLVAGGAIARIADRGRVAGRKPSKMIRSNSSGACPGRISPAMPCARCGRVRQRRLQVRVTFAHEEDPAQPVRRHDRPRPVVERERVRRFAVGHAREADLDDRRPAGHVVDDHLGAGLWIERREVARLDQDVVGV
jgi:hypothetical protein